MSEDGELRCEQCGEREATIHMTEIVDGEPTQRHLCEDCYNGEEMPALSSSAIFAQLIGALAPELQQTENERCPECGINYLEFRQNLIFGCPNDYEVFEAPLRQLLESIHGASEHVGRSPRGAAQRSNKGPRLEALRRELEEAVKQEDFEDAARLRDEIAELEQESVANSE